MHCSCSSGFGSRFCGRYVDVAVSVEVNSVEHLVEQLARASDERLTLQVLVLARTFAYKHNLCLRVAHSDNDVVARFAKSAFAAVFAG